MDKLKSILAMDEVQVNENHTENPSQSSQNDYHQEQ